MEAIRIKWAGGDATFQPGTTVRVGRGVEVEVQLQNPAVSRLHIELSYSPSGWVLRDVGSVQGTWSDGRQIQTVEVRGKMQVTLGREGRGEVLTLEAARGSSSISNRTETPERDQLSGPTQIVGQPSPRGGTPSRGADDGTLVVDPVRPNRPGGALREDAIAGATVVSGDMLNIECAGRSYSFRPGKDVSIGRDTSCDIVSSNPTVSRRHARIAHDGSKWTLRDEGSASGTFVDGRRITECQLSGAMAAWLGDATTGERLVVVASGTDPTVSRVRRRKVLQLILAVTALVAIVSIAWFVSTRRATGGPSLDRLSRATVRLLTDYGSGSGTIIDARLGLILTNAHVAAPDAPGLAVRTFYFDPERPVFAGDLDPTPRQIEVRVASGLDEAAEPAFIAEVVAADGYLDLAVIKITRTIGGQIIRRNSDDLRGLVDVAVGDSSKLSTGDSVRVLGYPSAAQSENVTLTDGVVSGPVPDERMGERAAMLNISAPVRAGNSGGLAVNAAGELVGVPSIVRDGQVASMRPSEFAKPLIEAARSGKPYVSALYRPLTTEKAVLVTTPGSAGSASGIRFDCSSGGGSTSGDAIGLQFTFDGFQVGEHQDMAFALYSDTTLLGTWTLDKEYPVKWPAPSGCATVTIPIDQSNVPATDVSLKVIIGLGPSYSTQSTP